MYAVPLLRTLAAVWALASCTAPAQIIAAQPAAAPGSGVKSVLVAGDDRLDVFDNAVTGVRTRLLSRGGGGVGDILRLSATAATAGERVLWPSLRNVLAEIAAMHPGPGQGCFVFATSHGGQGRGLWLNATGEFLTPRALDRALAQGCGDAPTAVVISGCFSGDFARAPMARANRVVLTAARADRTSFGCAAGRTYTAFDACLLEALDAGGTWRGAYGLIQRCVVAEEHRNDVEPSEPQAWFGAAVAGLPLPVRAASLQP